MTTFRRRDPPGIAQLLDLLGSPPVRDVARFLGVTERTVYAWRASGNAPRAACLALWWETSHGWQEVDCERENARRVLQSLSESLKNQVVTLQARIALLELTGDFGAANGWQQPTGGKAAPLVRSYEVQSVGQVYADQAARTARRR